SLRSHVRNTRSTYTSSRTSPASKGAHDPRRLGLGTFNGPARHHHLRQRGGALSHKQFVCLDGRVLHFPAHRCNHDGGLHRLRAQPAHPHRIHCRFWLSQPPAQPGHTFRPLHIVVLHRTHDSVGPHGL